MWTGFHLSSSTSEFLIIGNRTYLRNIKQKVGFALFWWREMSTWTQSQEVQTGPQKTWSQELTTDLANQGTDTAMADIPSSWGRMIPQPLSPLHISLQNSFSFSTCKQAEHSCLEFGFPRGSVQVPAETGSWLLGPFPAPGRRALMAPNPAPMSSVSPFSRRCGSLLSEERWF